MNKKILYKMINRYQIISFDVFDTLIERKVKHPTDVFRIVGNKVLGDEWAESFKISRVNAEIRARRMSENGEVTLDDIYSQLVEKYEEKTLLLREMEIKEEIDLCKPKDSMIILYHYAVSQKKTIYIISDMYLPQDVIVKMLNKCGVFVANKIYVSNECGVNKISGNLFHYVMEENELESHEWLHIGDSIRADCIGAIKAGIKFCLVNRKNRLRRLIQY